MRGLLELLGVLGFTLNTILISIIMGASWRTAHSHGSPMLHRLTEVWIAFLVVFSLPLIGRLEMAFDYLPDYDLYPDVLTWVWIAQTMLATALIRFLLALRQEWRAP